GAFASMANKGIDALAMNEDPLLVGNARAIVAMAARQRLPSIGFLEYGETGGLIAYGASIVEMHRRAAVFHRQDPQGSETRRAAGRAANQVQTQHKSQNGRVSRSGDPIRAAAPRQRGDRVVAVCCSAGVSWHKGEIFHAAAILSGSGGTSAVPTGRSACLL